MSESPKYWKSLEQWREDPEFKDLLSREFVSSPFAPEDSQSGWARREFLMLMGASLALTSFGCVRKAQKIVPYANRPEEIIPGTANYYASSFSDGNETFGTVVTTREGRPIKIAGNNEHPMNRGGMSARAHGHILSLYDPDRLNGAKRNLLNEKKTNSDVVDIAWEKLDKALASSLSKGSSVLLTGTVNSPSTSSLIGEFASAFGTQHIEWEAIDNSVIRKGQKLCYGQDVLPRPNIKAAKLIVSFAADFLGTHLSPVELTKDFSSVRNPAMGSMTKLVSFEPTLSLTGANADERHRVRASQLTDTVMTLLYHLVFANRRGSFANNSTVRSVLEPYKEYHNNLKVPEKVFKDLAEELWKHRGESLILAGGMAGQSSSALSLQIAVNFLNSVLGNDGKTIDYNNRPYNSYRGSTANLQKLVADMEAGKVKTLIIHDVNPVYAAPASLGFAKALLKVENVVYVGQWMNETARYANYVATDSNILEKWGDFEGQQGVHSLVQPTIRPLYDTRSFEDSLMAWARQAKRGSSDLRGESYYKYLSNKWKSHYRKNSLGKSDFDDFWVTIKQQGVLNFSKKSSSASARTFAARALGQISPSDHEGIELVLYDTSGLKDGSLGNVSWLQEFPDPVTKICWDNYLVVSPRYAAEKKYYEGQLAKITVNGQSRKVPVHIQPGTHDDVVALAVGFGRTHGGKIANGVGVAAFDLASVGENGIEYSGLTVSVEKLDEGEKLANVQGHHGMEGRQIVVQATLDKFNSDPDNVVHRHKITSAWKKIEYTGRKWGMSIDLSTCTGCSACVIACQSENNIPTVGKKYVLKGREMNWIRIDRYYTGAPDNPDTVFQPVNCFHCDNAPCETVCPVAATVHGEEGTNDMIYNRCVGTRYCANNCPYKSRRFNWFSYTDYKSPLHMALNPEVTVRHRGVMEKCTFCIHRIKDSRNQSLVDGNDDVYKDLQTACQESCPANAIVFGDQNDEKSAVTEAFQDVRSYSLLEELNAVPNVKYKYKVRHTAQIKGADDHGGGH